MLCHCVAMAHTADGFQEVMFITVTSTITGSQNAEGLPHLQLLKSIKPRSLYCNFPFIDFSRNLVYTSTVQADGGNSIFYMDFTAKVKSLLL